LPFFTLLLCISFASVNAVLFTPALPDIAKFFNVTEEGAQHTITWFLIGYALGQLLYGPVANRFGRKPALYGGIILQIISSLMCVFAGVIHSWPLLIVGRFLLALGSGVGLKITFTVVNETYEPSKASRTISYLMLAFAITPGLAVALGGFLHSWYGWESAFYAGAVYGLLLLILVKGMPETLKEKDLAALQWSHLIASYKVPFKNKLLVVGGLLMGCATGFIYIFAAVAPFLAMNIFGMNSAQYGLSNLIPPCGLVLGSLVGARLIEKYALRQIVGLGIGIACFGSLSMLVIMLMHGPILFSLFITMAVLYFGLCFVLPNASAIAMSSVSDKAHGSAVMNFINMGLSTVMVLTLGLFSFSGLLLPFVYLGICGLMILLFISIK
jgi:DHA1 family bicyclomycin/chloramphenicol resistance-like MFS transporter